MLLALLERLRERDVRLWADGDRLRFRAPEGAMTAELRAALVQHKPALLEWLATATATEAPLQPAGPTVHSSFAQDRLWVLDRLAPASIDYVVPARVRIDGPLNPAALSQALAEIVRRHAVLRTGFAHGDGNPWVANASLAPPAYVDLTAHGMSTLLELEPRPIELTRPPLLRVRLLQLERQAWLLELDVHHIAYDAASEDLLGQEARALYHAYANGLPSPLPTLPLQYSDFACWQRKAMQATLKRELAHWQTELAGASTVLELPTDHPRAARPRRRGGELVVDLAADRVAHIQAAAHRLSCTPQTLLLSAFVALLHRYSGQSDLLVGTPHTNRDQPQLESLIGFFVNTVVVRARLSPQTTFTELTRQLRERVASASEHRRLPFEQLIQAMPIERDAQRDPLVQALFVHRRGAARSLTLDGLVARPQRIASRSAKAELMLAVTETADGVSLAFEYDRDLFEPATIATLADVFGNLLAAAMTDPDQRIGSLPLLSADEAERMLASSRSAALPADEQTIDALVRRTASTAGDRIAVIDRTSALSYGELVRRAHRLAARLRARGVGRGARIGVHLPRTCELLVALLGILEAGGAYVPLDPRLPTTRLAFISEDAELTVVITDPLTTGLLPERLPSMTLVDDATTAGTTPPHEGSDLAYVLYTSGSTGVPKGVAIEHRSAVALLTWAAQTFGADDLARMLASTSLSFDLSVFELFAPLLLGGCVVIVDDILDFAAHPRGDITFLNTVPSAMRALLDADALPPSLRTVGLAGEPLPPSLARRITDDLGLSLFNLYGPTEATTYATWQCISSDGRVTIGRPVAGTLAVTLDDAGQLAPHGAVGELFLGGDSLARGYLRRPALTAASFVPNPFEGRGARLYATGDFASWSSQGELHYRGRRDFQVKLRGYRIELGEIESLLATHPDIADAIVDVDGSGADTRLCSWLVSRGVELSAPTIVAWLRERLPAYMIPAAIVPLTALPRTTNGKIDRRALPRPSVLGDTTACAPPTNRHERAVADVLCTLLSVPELGRDTSFFDAGAHSLLLVRALPLLRERLAAPLSLIDLFRFPTVRLLAASLQPSNTREPDDRERVIRRRDALAQQAQHRRGLRGRR